MTAPTPERFVIGGAPRLCAAVAMAVIAGALVMLAARLDWGIAWMAYVPAAALAVPAYGLARRIVLTRIDHELVVEIGWLMRRAWRLPLRDLELELVPTAGLHAVVAHRGGREYPLAVWLPRRRADALVAWLDGFATNGRWPRRVPRRPRGDR